LPISSNFKSGEIKGATTDYDELYDDVMTDATKWRALMLYLYIFGSIIFVKLKCGLYSGYHWELGGEVLAPKRGVRLIHGGG